MLEVDSTQYTKFVTFELDNTLRILLDRHQKCHLAK